MWYDNISNSPQALYAVYGLITVACSVMLFLIVAWVYDLYHSKHPNEPTESPNSTPIQRSSNDHEAKNTLRIDLLSDESSEYDDPETLKQRFLGSSSTGDQFAPGKRDEINDKFNRPINLQHLQVEPMLSQGDHVTYNSKLNALSKYRQYTGDDISPCSQLDQQRDSRGFRSTLRERNTTGIRKIKTLDIKKSPESQRKLPIEILREYNKKPVTNISNLNRIDRIQSRGIPYYQSDDIDTTPGPFIKRVSKQERINTIMNLTDILLESKESALAKEENFKNAKNITFQTNNLNYNEKKLSIAEENKDKKDLDDILTLTSPNSSNSDTQASCSFHKEPLTNKFNSFFEGSNQQADYGSNVSTSTDRTIIKNNPLDYEQHRLKSQQIPKFPVYGKINI